jgi:hypothetical protein
MSGLGHLICGCKVNFLQSQAFNIDGGMNGGIPMSIHGMWNWNNSFISYYVCKFVLRAINMGGEYDFNVGYDIMNAL